MPQKGDRYIIEIEEVCPAMLNDGSDALYRIKGFRSLVFDKYGLNMLKKLEPALAEVYRNGYEAAFDDGVKAGKLAAEGNSYAEGLADGRKEFHLYDYQAGLDKAWAAVRLLLKRDKYQEYNHEFAGLTAPEIICSFPVDEVVKRLEATEKEPRLRVGDEVQFESSEKRFVITEISNGLISGFAADGSQFCDKNAEKWKPTGRHFPIADLLKQMEGGNE